ncbi:MAG: NAD(P)/FAD-dependent oxidoreductase [Oscillospiraceae bacterium]
MKKYDVIIIGAGSAGLMCGRRLAEGGKNVLLIEKMNRVGKKLLICGKGRCNVTNNSDVESFMKNIKSNMKFMYSALYNFTPYDTMNFFENKNIPLKTERGNRVFPVSDKSSDIVDCLKDTIEKNGGSIMLNTTVSDILTVDNKIIGVKCDNGTTLDCENLVICTGGLSYKATGSTGDGYIFAKKTGHTIKNTMPALVPLQINDRDCIDLQGLSLKNVTLSLINKSKNKVLYKELGELMFTHFGATGPLILRSSFYLDYKDIKNHKISIDLKPGLDLKMLDTRILRDFDENINKIFANSLNKLLPKKIIPIIIKKSGIDENKKVNEITKEERQNLLQEIKNFSFSIDDLRPIDYAIVTRGGVSVKDINPSTIESKLIKNLYFAGEVIDVDAYTGGFNLQMSFATAVLAAESILGV